MRASQVLALLLLAYVAQPAAAETWRLVSGPGFSPYADPDLPRGGMLTELVAEALRADDQDAEIIFKPWNRGYLDMIANEFDATFPYARTAERERECDYSPSMITVVDRMFVLTEHRDRRPAMESFANSTVCRPNGYALLGLAQWKEKLNLDISRPQDMKACFRLLAMGRVDGVMAEPALAAAEAVGELGKMGAISPVGVPLGEVGLHLISHRPNPRSAGLQAAFVRGLDKLRAQGREAEILARHFRAFFGEAAESLTPQLAAPAKPKD